MGTRHRGAEVESAKFFRGGEVKPLRKMNGTDDDIPVIIVTGKGNGKVALEVTELGVLVISSNLIDIWLPFPVPGRYKITLEECRMHKNY
jgi:hypothetical protein